MITAYHDAMETGCGVTVWGEFGYKGFSNYRHEIRNVTRPEGGAGIHCALFVYKDPVCDAAFQELSSRFKLRYKSRVRKNRNSGNKVYFAVFEQSAKEQYGWED